MCDKMMFPKTFKEFAEYYGFKDEKWAYTNNAELIPVFRVEQWLDHINAKTQMVDESTFDERSRSNQTIRYFLNTESYILPVTNAATSMLSMVQNLD